MNPFRRANRRHLRRHPLQAALSMAGIALGVAVVLAVDLANHSALRAFRIAEQAVAGDATHRIVPVAAHIDEAFYRVLRVEHGFRQSAPRVTGSVSAPDGRTLQVLGIDPLAAAASTSRSRPLETRVDAGALIGTPGATVVTPATAQSLGVSRGDRFSVTLAGQQRELRVAGILAGDRAASEGLRQVLIMDIATAQVLLDQTGLLDRIDLTLRDGERRRLEAVLPDNLALRPVESGSRAMAHMTRAFQINLTALSLLALLIGAFLIYNIQTLFVLNRREVFAIWRTLGVTRAQVMRQVLAEAAWLGLGGCVLGVAAGIGLSQLLLDLVTRSINDLYFTLEVSRLDIDPLDVAKACGLGLGASLAAAAVPAAEAARVQPRLALSRSQLESTAHRLRRAGAAAALILWTAGAAILTLSQRSIVAGFAGLFCVVIGFAFLVPGGLRLIVRGATPLLDKGFGWMGRWSGRNVLASMSRTQVAVAALTISLAATIGISVMIQSFRLTVEHWLDNYLRADIYISRAADSGAGIRPALLQDLRGLPETASVSTGRWVRLPTAGEPTRLFALDVDRRGFGNFQLVNRSSDAAWPRFSDDDGVIVSESYAYHRGLSPGDTLSLPTAGGRRAFTVIDTFYDYGSDRGTVAMHRRTYDRHWNDPVFESMAVYLAPRVDLEAFLSQIESGLLAGTGLRARSNRSIKDASLRVFDRTFTVTEVLRLLTIIVAGIGILSALVAIQLDRTREFAVLRASGVTRGELSRLMVIEGSLMGTASALLSIPLGIALAALLVFVINKRSFGWSMQFTVSWEQALLALGLGLAAGALAAVYPAWRMNRQTLVAGLRYE